MQALPLEQERSENREDNQGNHFLQDFELDQAERPSVSLETDAVRRNLERVLEQGNRPRKQDNGIQRPVRTDFHFLELQMPVPGECHEDIGNDQHPDGCQNFWIHRFFFASFGAAPFGKNVTKGLLGKRDSNTSLSCFRYS